MRALLLVLVLPALALAGAASAQTHEHGGAAGARTGAVVLSDGPADGRAVVGGLTHFGFALVDENGKPLAHRDARFEVLHDNVTVFASEDTHEYDGLFSFDVTFHEPGPYRVVATSEDLAPGLFEGVVVEPVYETAAAVTLDVVVSPASNVVSATVSVVDGHGTLLPHTDALVEVRRAADLRLVTRWHAHVHEEPITFTQAFPPGEHVLRVVGYRAFPDGEDPDLRAVVAETRFSVGPVPTPAAPALPTPPRPLQPIGASAEKDGYALHATYDPYNQVGLGAPFRLGGLVVGPDKAPLAHVDFELAVNGPGGQVFRSASLHEYDGVFEWLYAPAAPGAYDATLTAKVRGVTLTVPYAVHVLPPVVPLDGGPHELRIEGLDAVQAGVPANLTFRIAGPAGPLAHSEIDVTLLRPGGPPTQSFKLHTHESGDFSALVLFPEEGDWLLHVDAFPLLPQAALVQGPGGPGAPLVFPVSVAAADPAREMLDVERQGGREAPLPGIAAFAGLALLALARRRRA